VLQEREIIRVGGNAVTPINVRIIVATHKNLLEEVKNKRFREDLYYRLIGLPIELPPLRDRGNDILILAKHFTDHFCKENKMEKKTLTADAQEKLLHYAFPGNIRELKSTMELAVVMADGEQIEASHITLNTNGSISNLLSQETSLKEYTNQIIQHYLDKYESDVLLVAKKLDIGKSTIYRMLKNDDLLLN
jgi:two-component system response regulator AtoC